MIPHTSAPRNSNVFMPAAAIGATGRRPATTSDARGVLATRGAHQSLHMRLILVSTPVVGFSPFAIVHR